MNRVSPLSSVVFWPCALAYNDINNLIDVCALAVTFNTEDKNKAIRDFQPYFHKILKTDTITVALDADVPANVIKLLAITEAGVATVIKAFTVVNGDYLSAVVSTAELAAFDGQKIYFAVWDDTADTIDAVSDLTSVQTVIHGGRSVVVDYQNSNYDYAGASKDTAFQVRLPATFSLETSPEEIESEEHADGNVVGLTSSIKTQRLLKLLPVPPHIHRQVKVAIKCTSLQIKSKSWAQEEAYELGIIHEDFEFSWGRVRLTEQGSMIRNVYKI